MVLQRTDGKLKPLLLIPRHCNLRTSPFHLSRNRIREDLYDRMHLRNGKRFLRVLFRVILKADLADIRHLGQQHAVVMIDSVHCGQMSVDYRVFASGRNFHCERLPSFSGNLDIVVVKPLDARIAAEFMRPDGAEAGGTVHPAGKQIFGTVTRVDRLPESIPVRRSFLRNVESCHFRPEDSAGFNSADVKLLSVAFAGNDPAASFFKTGVLEQIGRRIQKPFVPLLIDCPRAGGLHIAQNPACPPN